MPGNGLRSLAASHLGPDVPDRLAGKGSCLGKAIAVFDSVLYLELDSGMLCITLAHVDPGAFTVTLVPARGPIMAEMATGQDVWASSQSIGIGPHLVVNLRGALPRRAPEWPARTGPAMIARGLTQLGDLARGNPDMPGIGGLYFNRQRATGGSASEMTRIWEELAKSGFPTDGDLGWARRLIGLGPGLTPSGDDFLCGMLIAQHAIGDSAGAARLWQAVRSEATRSTNAISLALMESAARGTGNASFHKAILAVLSAAVTADALSGIARTGHSSGWDALAGACTVLECYVRRHQATVTRVG